MKNIKAVPLYPHCSKMEINVLIPYRNHKQIIMWWVEQTLNAYSGVGVHFLGSFLSTVNPFPDCSCFHHYIRHSFGLLLQVARASMPWAAETMLIVSNWIIFAVSVTQQTFQQFVSANHNLIGWESEANNINLLTDNENKMWVCVSVTAYLSSLWTVVTV